MTEPTDANNDRVAPVGSISGARESTPASNWLTALREAYDQDTASLATHASKMTQCLLSYSSVAR